MDMAMMGGVVRAVAAPTLAYAVGKGWLHAGDVDWIIAGGGAVLTAAWSMWTKRPAHRR